MATAFPVRETERTAKATKAMLRMMLNHGHIDDDGLFSVTLEAWQIDLLSSYGAAEVDLEDSDDDQDEAVL